MKSLFPEPSGSNSMQATLARIGDGDGTSLAETDLSTPIVSTQDGPRIMGTSNFGGKKAAPFRKGGKPRKRLLAKAALRAKVKGADLSNIDLAFNPREPRDAEGKWAKGGPGWTPEKGARSQEEFDFLQAKNSLSQAMLSGKEHKIKRAKKHLAKKSWAYTQHQNAEKAVQRAANYYANRGY